MPVYQPNIPTGTVNLDVDYLNLQGNFNQANIVYGTDHYPFDNATPNQGFHNLVTTPPVVNNPPDGLPPATAAGILKFYAYQQYAAIGPLQWSRGPSNALPSPLTRLSGGPVSIPMSGGTTTLFDMAGMTRVMLIVNGFNDTTTVNQRGSVNQFVNYSQGVSNVPASATLQTIQVVLQGTVLKIANGSTAFNLGAYYWTITFLRIE